MFLAGGTHPRVTRIVAALVYVDDVPDAKEPCREEADEAGTGAFVGMRFTADLSKHFRRRMGRAA